MWCHLSTGFRPLRLLRFVALSLLLVVLSTTVFFANIAHAAPATTKTLNFQGRLQTATGSIVADGHYNMQFKIYQGGTGTAAGNPGGTLKWTETYINNGGTTGVDIKNGLFSVNLGSVNPFGSSVDWTQDTLFLSMNVAGSATACTTFGSSPCSADGEMLPMKKLTAVPFAINAENADMIDGLTSSQLIQNTTTPQSANIAVQSAGTTDVAALIQGAPSQTADILQVKASGTSTPLLAVSSQGFVNIQGTSEDADAFSVKTSLGNKVFTVDTENARVGIGLLGTSAPSLSGYGLEVQGALRLSGGNSSNMTDTYLTPVGSSVGTKINIPSYDPGAYGQILAMGLPSTANSTSRVMSLFDARTGAHQPTLTVFSPDENQVLGFSWDGSNTNAKIKTSSDNLSLNVGGQDLVTATKSGSNGILYVGNGATSSAPASFSIQATTSTTASVTGGALTVQGGGATTGNTNGGNLTLSGGTSSGSGANGLVVLTTPTIQQVNDSCVNAVSDCTIATSSLNNNGSIVVGFDSSVSGKTASLPDPTITTAGRLLYVTAASGSSDFTLAFNGGGAGNKVTMRQNTATSLIWNGTDWIVVGASNSTTLQDAYNNTPQSAGGAEIVIGNDANSGGLTIRDSNTNPVNNTVLNVQSASAANLFSVNDNINELATDPGAETAGASNSTFPSNTWTSYGGGATINRYTTAGTRTATGIASVEVNTDYAWSGTMNKLSTTLTASTTYNVSLAVRASSGTISDFLVYYSKSGTDGDVWCSDNIAVSSTAWTRVNCTFTTPASGITSSNSIFMGVDSNGSKTMYIDNLSVTSRTNAAPNVQVGGGQTGGPATLFTIDKAASAPLTGDHDALLGSMYYDTTLGKVQCYEAEGWGACGASPDIFVTLSPEYASSVTNGAGIGIMTSDLCSDSLNINDGSSAQPTVCGTNETYNFYNWTSSESTTQTKSIYVTYKLPGTFKEFVAGSTTLMGRTDSANSSVTYQVYRNNASGLSACGSAVSVSTGSQSTWQTATANGSADPSTCGFTTGESIVIRINFNAKDNANAYVSNLGFTISNN